MVSTLEKGPIIHHKLKINPFDILKYTMRKAGIALFLVISLSAFIKGDNSKIFKKLYRLEGTWLMKTKNGFIGEEWKKMDKFHLKSRGMFIKGTDTVVSEIVNLVKNTNGIFFISSVEDQNNKKPISFKLTSSDDNEYVFENPEHDFPKRIVYKLASPDSIHAYIDAGPAIKQQNFYYKRQ